MINTPAVLLFGFSQGEAVQLEALLPGSPVRVISVPDHAWSLTLEQLLEGKTPPALAAAVRPEPKMAVFAFVPTPMLHYLLAACGQVTGNQKVLRAVLTDSNRTWTALELHSHLLEEDLALRGKQT